MAIKEFLKIFAQYDKLVLYIEPLKFVFKSNIFHQICGVAIGAKLALTLALVVLADYKEEYPFLNRSPGVYFLRDSLDPGI